MAIPLSCRRANRRPRPRRNSLDPSATRGLSQLGDLGDIGDLSLSSQLMCAAILEAWRLLRAEVAPAEEVTGECEEAAEAEAEEVISALENISRMMRMRTARRHSLPATLPDTSTDQEVGVTYRLSIYLTIY